MPLSRESEDVEGESLIGGEAIRAIASLFCGASKGGKRGAPIQGHAGQSIFKSPSRQPWAR